MSIVHLVEIEEEAYNGAVLYQQQYFPKDDIAHLISELVVCGLRDRGLEVCGKCGKLAKNDETMWAGEDTGWICPACYKELEEGL